MTTRDLVNSPAIKFLFWGIAFGAAYKGIEAKVENKADKTEVTEIRGALESMARDVKVLRMIACKQAQSDSFCESQP